MQTGGVSLSPYLRRTQWWPYIVAATVTGLTTAPLVFLERHLTAFQVFDVSLIYLVPVLLSATLGGFGPGVVAAVVALFAFDWYFLTPPYTVTVTNPQDLVAFAVFLGAALLAGQLSASARRHARDTALLHDLSATLSASPHPVEMLDAVARRIGEVFRFSQCTLSLHDGETAGTRGHSTTAAPSGAEVHVVAPVRRGTRETGQLCLAAQRGHRLRVHERQVLETLVSAAALAIERAQLAAEERAAAVAQESDRLKSALLSTVSHELRTPLASIKATTSGLLEGDVSYDTATLRQFLSGIDGEADRLIRLVSNLLDVSRIEAGALRPDRDWYDLEELIGTGLDALGPHLARHRVVRAIAPDLPLVWCDYVQILQVLTNLLENAARYAPAGTTITIAARADGDEILLTVSDEGPGVGTAERATIFNAFVRGPAAGERSGGVGLGLAISKGLVDANGGRIWVDEAPGGGAAFTVALPCRRDSHLAPVPEHDGADAQAADVGAALSGATGQRGGGS